MHRDALDIRQLLKRTPDKRKQHTVESRYKQPRYKKPLDIGNVAPAPLEFVWENEKLALLESFLNIHLVIHTVSYNERVELVGAADITPQ